MTPFLFFSANTSAKEGPHDQAAGARRQRMFSNIRRCMTTGLLSGLSNYQGRYLEDIGPAPRLPEDVYIGPTTEDGQATVTGDWPIITTTGSGHVAVGAENYVNMVVQSV